MLKSALDHPRKSASLAAITAVLLIVAASRIIHITTLTMNWDEVWSIWQTFGSANDIIRWTPPDWTPVYFLFLGGWQNFAGIQPVVLRVSSLLASMLGAAFTYRAAKRLAGEAAGLFTMLIYGALGYVIFLGLVVRAYTFLLALTSLAIWLTLRYFDRPTIWRALPLTLCCLSLWFLHYTAAFVFPLLGLLTLFKYGRAIWRWWLPGGIVAAAATISILSNASEFYDHTAGSNQVLLPPLPQALAQVYGTFTYPAFLIWLLLFIIAGALLFKRRALRGQAFAFLVWLAAPIAVYLGNRWVGLFQDFRYLWWTLTGLIFWLGLGLSLLPRRSLQIAAALVITLVAIVPFSIDNLQFYAYTALDYNFKLLQQNIQPGDVLLIDSNCDCGPAYVWDYFMKIYFPNGLPFVKSAQGYRRVWYVSTDWLDDPATKASVEQGRVAEKYFGPAKFLFRLYEAPPDPVGILYPNGMRFHGADIERYATPGGPIYHEGETVKVRFWWSVDHPVALDYSLSLLIYGNGSSVTQLDGPPHPVEDDGTADPTATSQWKPGQIYIDEWDIPLPYPLKDGTYPIWMALYYWQNQKRLVAPGVDGRGLLNVAQVIVHAW